MSDNYSNQRKDNRNNNNHNNNHNGNNEYRKYDKRRKFNVNPKSQDPMGTPYSMMRHALHIFKDIAYGRWDFGVESDIFKNEDFLKNAMKAAYDKFMEASIHENAIKIAFPNTLDGMTITVLRQDQRTKAAYWLIWYTLNLIMCSKRLPNGYTTPDKDFDVGFLLILVNQLPEYKYDL